VAPASSRWRAGTGSQLHRRLQTHPQCIGQVLRIGIAERADACNDAGIVDERGTGVRGRVLQVKPAAQPRGGQRAVGQILLPLFNMRTTRGCIRQELLIHTARDAQQAVSRLEQLSCEGGAHAA
jgi:hypothetical protein